MHAAALPRTKPCTYSELRYWACLLMRPHGGKPTIGAAFGAAVVSRLFHGCFRCFTVGRMPPVAAPPTTVRVVLVVATQLTQLPPRLCGSLARTSSPPPPPTHTTACFTQRQRPRCGHPSSQHYHSAALLGQDLGRHAQVGAVQAGERSAESCGRLVRPGDIGAE